MENNNLISLSINSNSTELDKFYDRLSTFGYKIHSIDSIDNIKNENWENTKPNIVFINAPTEDNVEELCNASKKFKELLPNSMLICVMAINSEVHYSSLEEIQFDLVYQFPLEEELLINAIFENSPIDLENHQLSLDIMARVNVFDLKEGEQVPFDLYVCLPANKKVILYNKKEAKVDKEMMSKFKENPHYNLYIKKTDLNSYYQYCTMGLSSIKTSSLSEIEKQKAINTELKKLMGGFFDSSEKIESDSQQLLDNLGKVIGQLEDSSGSKKVLSERINRIAAQQLTSYSHSKNVSIYCALFGMAVGINEPESLRMGGFLHDLGMSDLPSELWQKDFSDMNDDEKAQFMLHPGNAKMTLSMKKLNLPKEVEQMILQHHEHMDGSGFPYGLEKDKIHPYAKVCAFADEFDVLTSVREGYKQLSPRQAMLRISGIDGKVASPIYDPEFHLPIVEQFLTGKLSLDEPFEYGNGDNKEDTVYGNIKIKKGA